MRLDLASKCSFLQRLQMRLIKQSTGIVPGPAIVMSYKRNFFGKHFTECVHEAMRQMTQWSKGEVELFAAFVSKLNDCAY